MALAKARAAKVTAKTKRSGAGQAKSMAARGKGTGSKSSASASKAKTRAKNGSVARQSSFARRNWAKRLVFMGNKVKTGSGLFKRDLIRNKRGRVVSKRKSAIGRRRFHENHIDLWTQSLLEARDEQEVQGFLLCKKAGTKAQRDLYKGTEVKWKAAVRDRMLRMFGKIGRFEQPGSRSLFSDLDMIPVKDEHDSSTFRQGDRVRLKSKAGSSTNSRREVGIVERFQLGRFCINFDGALKTVKPEELEKVR